MNVAYNILGQPLTRGQESVPLTSTHRATETDVRATIPQSQ